jgi:ABC-type Na+ efflux pump permease subunit
VFERGPLSQMIAVERVERGEGRARLERGDASALLIIPKGLGQAYLRNQPFEVSLVTNPAQQIVPNIIEETVSGTLDLGFYVQLLAGDQLRAFSGGQGTLTEAGLSGSVVTLWQRYSKVRAYLDPPLISLKTAVVEQRASTPGFGALFFPCLLFQSVLFITMGLSADLWRERRQGTFRRLVSTPSRLEAVLAGKVLSVGLLLLAMGAAGLAAGRWLIGLDASNAGAALVWIVGSGVVLFSLMLVLQTLASSERGANLLTNLILMPLMMLGGTFFPFEIMPAGLAAVGRWTPNGWLLQEFKAVLAGSLGPARLGLGFAGLAGLAALAFLVASRRVQARFVV